jgi:hypothetical protein
MAVGFSLNSAARAIAETWDGQSWRMRALPQPPAGFARGSLLGISCVAAGCTAAGAHPGTVRTQVTLAMGGPPL